MDLVVRIILGSECYRVFQRTVWLGVSKPLLI